MHGNSFERKLDIIKYGVTPTLDVSWSSFSFRLKQANLIRPLIILILTINIC